VRPPIPSGGCSSWFRLRGSRPGRQFSPIHGRTTGNGPPWRPHHAQGSGRRVAWWSWVDSPGVLICQAGPLIGAETLDGAACQCIPISVDGSTDRRGFRGFDTLGTMRAKPHRSQAIAAPRGENRTHAGPRHIGQAVGIFMASVRASRDPYAIAGTYAATVRRFDMPPVQPAVGAFECWVFSSARERNTRPQHVGGCHRYAHGQEVTCQGCLSRLTCRPIHRFALHKGGIKQFPAVPWPFSTRAHFGGCSFTPTCPPCSPAYGGNLELPPPSAPPF